MRRINLLPMFTEPHKTAFGAVYDSGDYAVALEEAGFDFTSKILIQPNGQILLGGRDAFDFILMRFNSNGALDTSFGTNSSGVVTTAFDGTYSDAFALALQSNGDIVATAVGVCTRISPRIID